MFDSVCRKSLRINMLKKTVYAVLLASAATSTALFAQF
ncbi:MAG: hypothetical protein ACI9PZ_003177, partial [Parvicella sp.]